MDEDERWSDLDMLLTRPGNITGPGFEPGPECRECLRDQVLYCYKKPRQPMSRHKVVQWHFRLQCEPHSGCALRVSRGVQVRFLF